jgi:uncharacterized protein GlcG (DUF336 family)
MSNFRETVSITHAGAMKALMAAADHATAINVPQCVFIVDVSGETVASIRMDGTKYLSMHTARSKARTAASINSATAPCQSNSESLPASHRRAA